MQLLQQANELVVVQKKEWGEILTELERRNKYRVFGADGQEMLRAQEVGGSFLTRLLLRSWRPFRMALSTPDDRTVLQLYRPFRFFFTEIQVADVNGRALGRVQRRFSFLRRIYSVFDATGRETCQLYGPLLHPWTFEVRRDGRTLGRIGKRWGGVLREGFTDADTFGISFPAGFDATTKSILLGATFLIDFAHFEKSR